MCKSDDKISCDEFRKVQFESRIMLLIFFKDFL